MALVFCEGFEQYITAASFSTSSASQYMAPLGSTTYGWVQSSGTNTIADTTVVRSSQAGTGKSLKVVLSSLSCKMPNPSTLIIGFGFRTSGTSYNSTIAHFSDQLSTSANLGLKIRSLTTGAIDVYNELTNTVIVSSATGLITANNWHYIELKIIFGLAGFVEVKIDEVSACSASVVDTLCGASSAYFFHLSNSGTNSFYFDDLYICDDSGSSNNDYLGAMSVLTLFPTADGTTTDFSVTGSTNNYLALNNPEADFTSYTHSPTSGAKDLFEVQNLPTSPSSIAGVMVSGRVKDQGSSASANRELGIRTSGTELFGSAQKAPPGGCWANIKQVFEKQADNTSSWDETAVNNMQIGIKNS